MADPTFLNPISILTQFDVDGGAVGGGGISIDITQKVTENYPKIITQNPIEDGSPSTDHIINLLPRLQIQGGFSDLKVTNLTGTTINTLAGDPSVRNRAKNKFDRLLELSISNELFLLMDGFHLFKNVQFNNLQLLKDREGFSVFFQADLQVINIIDFSGGVGPKPLSAADILVREAVSSTTLLTVGSTVEQEALASIGVIA